MAYRLIPRKRQRWLMRVPLHPNHQRLARPRRETTRKERLIDCDLLSGHGRIDEVMLAISSGLNRHGTRLKLVGVDEGQCNAIRPNPLDQCGHIRRKSRTAAIRIEMTHLSVQGQRPMARTVG